LPSSYDDYDVTQLFQAVRDASEQLAPSRAQVLAWRRAVQALDKHRERLDSLRGQLAAKWPPETNAASAAYLRELDRLIDAVHQTSVAAASNQVHIEHVANAIDRAKREIEPLHDEYVENRTKLAQYENTLNEVGANATYVSGPLGGYLARKGAGIVLAPPVADGR
jgi:chromosome segregation ATPase